MILIFIFYQNHLHIKNLWVEMIEMNLRKEEKTMAERRNLSTVEQKTSNCTNSKATNKTTNKTSNNTSNKTSNSTSNKTTNNCCD